MEFGRLPRAEASQVAYPPARQGELEDVLLPVTIQHERAEQTLLDECSVNGNLAGL